mgnify:CR=1 FL=1
MNLRDAKVLVTGGHGFLGRHVVKVLREQGCGRVWSTSHNITPS